MNFSLSVRFPSTSPTMCTNHPIPVGGNILVYFHQVSVLSPGKCTHIFIAITLPPTGTLLDPQGTLNAGAPRDPSNFIMLGLILQSSWPAAAS